MRHLECRNLHRAIPVAVVAARNRQDSGPVVVEITNPVEPVVFWPQLTLNPFLLFRESVCLISSVKNPAHIEQPGAFASSDRGKLNFTLFEPDGIAEAVVTPWLMLHQWLAAVKNDRLGSFFRVLCPPQANTSLSNVFANVSAEDLDRCDPYAEMFKPSPMVTSDPIRWKQELDILCNAGTAMGFTDRWIRRTAVPIWTAWVNYTSQGGSPRDRAEAAMETVDKCESKDWKFACDQWLVKRLDE